MAANYDIGPRVGIEGEKTFQTSLNAIKSNVKDLGSQMRLLTAEFDGSADGMEALVAKNDLLKKTVTATQKQIDLLGGEYDRQVRTLSNLEGALNKANKEFGEHSVEAAKAQNAYNRQSIEVQKLATQMNNAKASMAKMTREIEDNDKAMEELNRSSAKFDKAFGFIGTAAKNMLGLRKNTENVADSMNKAGKHSLTFGSAVKAIVTSQAIVGGFRMMGQVVADLGRNMVDFAKSGLEVASDLQEVQNVVDVTFGSEGAAVIENFAKGAASSFGMSALSAKEFTGTMGAMLKSMNLTDGEVLEMSQALTGLAGDMASFYNLDAEEAFSKLRSGISGETEPLKQLGINMSVANLEAYALSKGINTAWKEMTQAEQATLRYQYIMQATSDAQGDFARTSDSYANQQRIMQLNLENLSATIGQKLLPVMNNFTGVFNSLLSGDMSLGGFAARVGTEISNLLTQFSTNLPAITAAGGELVGGLVTGLTVALPQVLSAGQEILGQLGQGLLENLPTMVDTGLTVIGRFASTIIDSLPTVLQTGYDILATVAEGIIAKVPDMVAKLPEIISSFAKFFTANFPKFVEMGGKLIVNLVAGLVKSGPQLINAAGDLVESVMTYFIYRVKGFVDIGKNIVQGILQGLNKSWSDVTSWFKNKVNGLVNTVKSALGIRSPSRVFAEIGEYSAEGIGVGFSDKISAVSRKIQKDVSKIVPTVDSQVEVTGRAVVPNSGTGQSQGGVTAAELKKAMSGMGIYMSGRKVGKLVSLDQSNTARAMGV